MYFVLLNIGHGTVAMSIIPNIGVHCSTGSPPYSDTLVPLCVPILVRLADVYQTPKNSCFHMLVLGGIISERDAHPCK